MNRWNVHSLLMAEHVMKRCRDEHDLRPCGLPVDARRLSQHILLRDRQIPLEYVQQLQLCVGDFAGSKDPSHTSPLRVPATRILCILWGDYEVSVRFDGEQGQTFVARTMAAMKIRSHTKVTPNEFGSRRALARFRYACATKSVEILDREEVITEQMKCLNSHICLGVLREPWPMRGPIRDEINWARLAT